MIIIRWTCFIYMFMVSLNIVMIIMFRNSKGWNSDGFPRTCSTEFAALPSKYFFIYQPSAFLQQMTFKTKLFDGLQKVITFTLFTITIGGKLENSIFYTINMTRSIFLGCYVVGSGGYHIIKKRYELSKQLESQQKASEEQK